MLKALVTGASGGLGKSLSIALLEQKYDVYALGRNREKLDALESMGCKTLECDFLVRGWFDEVVKFCPDVSVLINNAGTFPLRNLEGSTLADFDSCFEVNVRTPYRFMQEYVPKMHKQGYGRVVNVLSSSAFAGSADTGIYCASKHALLGLTRSSFLENRGTNISVYSVCPGSMKTEMGATDFRQDYSTFIEPAEVAKFIMYTLSLNSGMIIDEARLNRTIIR